MAMIGYFWIGPDSVHLGAPPTEHTPGVQLTPDGVRSVAGDLADSPEGETWGVDGDWRWTELNSFHVGQVPTGDPTSKFLGSVAKRAVEAALTAVGFGGVPDQPPVLSARLLLGDGTTAELTALSAAEAYTVREAQLSQHLLDRLVTGETSVETLLDWGRAQDDLDHTPREAKREELLWEWGGRDAE